jgi:hypothetical protein
MKRRQILYLFLLPLLQAAAQQPDATQLMNRSGDLTKAGSMSSIITLTMIEKNGTTRKRVISMVTKSYPDGGEKRLIKFVEPADVRGTSMLIVDNKRSADEMWIYLPALMKTRRIVSSEKGKSFMSSEFSNADLSSPSPSDFTDKHLQNSGENNLWVIESTPIDKDKADEYGYSKKVSYIATDNLHVKKIEYFNYDNKIFKTMEIKAIQTLEGGKYIVKDMIAKNLLNGRSSEIRLDNIVTNTAVEDSFFSLQNLER